MSFRTKRLIGVLISLTVLTLDQWSKAWVLSLVGVEPFPIVICPFFNLVLVKNYGISFGFLAHATDWMPLALTTITMFITCGLAVWMLRAEDRITINALGFIVGGATGNIIDRLRFGAVTDFLDVHLDTLHWPAFNLADSAVFIGVVLLLLLSILPLSHTKPEGQEG